MRKAVYLLFLLVLWRARPAAAEGAFEEEEAEKPAVKEMESGEFAGSVVLAGREGRLLSMEIPGEVYQGLKRADMADMRIFDAGGLPVPFAVRPVPGAVFTPPPRDVPFFIWEEENGALPAGTDIVIDTSGTVVRVNSRGGGTAAGGAGSGPVYLLDCSGFTYAPSSLVLSVEEGDNYNSAVRLFSGTEDLSRWQETERRQIVARYGNSGANRDTVRLSGTGARYVLLKFESPVPPLLGVTAYFDEVTSPPPRLEKTAAGTFRDERRRAVDYDTGGFYPLVSVNFILPEADSVEALVKYRTDNNGEWRNAGRMTLFRFSGEDGEKTHEPMDAFSSAPYWELESLSFPFAKAPEGIFIWEAREIVFPGRGKGPWTLAFGNPRAGPPESFTVPAGTAAERAAAGEFVYRKDRENSPPPRRFGEFLLWGILGTAALVLTGLACYAAGIIKKGDPS
ncbi:MAG: DUF3999 domain-containing protein [Treponema sp.]|nr:DUF3999 domain-containing protein [Treponema sp.]